MRVEAARGGDRGRRADDPADHEGAELPPPAAALDLHAWDRIPVLTICTLGDAVLDVVVRLDAPLADDDDVTAATRTGAGGQAANVAAWAAALGASARCIARRGDDAAGALVAGELSRRGVELVGPVVAGRTGVVVSIVTPDGKRTMASDRGAGGDFSADELDPAWLEGADWLHVSGYTIATRSAIAERAAELVRARGGRVSVDLSSVTVIESFGADAFAARIERMQPTAIFATEAERNVLPCNNLQLGNTVWVVKRGPRGIVVDGVEHAAAPAEVVDTTGAGDALAAGFLVGGAELALATAARCVATVGSLP
jgi:sugar/nucleoside kinase (ribokinase family)